MTTSGAGKSSACELAIGTRSCYRSPGAEFGSSWQMDLSGSVAVEGRRFSGALKCPLDAVTRLTNPFGSAGRNGPTRDARGVRYHPFAYPGFPSPSDYDSDDSLI